MRSRVSVLGSVVVVAAALSACGGGGSGSSSSTLAPEDATVFKTIPTTSTTLSPSTIPGAAGGLPQDNVYEVKPNDTWIGIAKQFGCANYLELIAYNDNRQSIFPGETVNIPTTCGQTPTDTTPAAGGGSATTAPSASTAKTTTTVADPNSATYTIAAGDTLSGIAKKFDTTMSKIVALNGWGGIDHVLIPGKDIKVPVAG